MHCPRREEGSKGDDLDGQRIHPPVFNARVTQRIYKNSALRIAQPPKQENETDPLPNVDEDQTRASAQIVGNRTIHPTDGQGFYVVSQLQNRSSDEGFTSSTTNCIIVVHWPIRWGGGELLFMVNQNQHFILFHAANFTLQSDPKDLYVKKRIY